MSGAKWKIRSGDVIELIPGHYLFKYVAADDTTEGRKPTTTREKRPSGEESSKGKQLAQSRKRVHRATEEEALAENSHVLPFGFMVCLPMFETVIFNYSGPGLQDVLQRNNQEPNTLIEGIRNFRISKNKLPLTFRLMKVQQLPEWANTNAVSINDVIQVKLYEL